MFHMRSRKDKEMTKVTDSKGQRIEVGSLIKVKNSNIVREVQNGARALWGTPVLYVDKDGLIMARRIDGKAISYTAWVKPSQVEVVG